MQCGRGRTPVLVVCKVMLISTPENQGLGLNRKSRKHFETNDYLLFLPPPLFFSSSFFQSLIPVGQYSLKASLILRSCMLDSEGKELCDLGSTPNPVPLQLLAVGSKSHYHYLV